MVTRLQAIARYDQVGILRQHHVLRNRAYYGVLLGTSVLGKMVCSFILHAVEHNNITTIKEGDYLHDLAERNQFLKCFVLYLYFVILVSSVG